LPDPTARGLFTARDEPQKVDRQPPSVVDRAPSAQDDTNEPPNEPEVASTDETSDQDRRIPAIRLDEARIEAPAPRPELSPAQALELVRRAARRTGHDPDRTP